MQSWGLVTITILVICVCKKGHGADLVFRCPDILFAGKVSTLTLKVNKTVVDAAECYQPPKVIFGRKRVSDNPKAPNERLCEIEYSCNDPGPVDDPTNDTVQCRCVKKSQHILVFEMKFIADKQLDASANFSYGVCFGPRKTMTKDVQGSCSLVSVATADEIEGSGGCGTGCIVGIVLGIVGVSVLAVIAGFCFVKKNRAWRGTPVAT